MNTNRTGTPRALIYTRISEDSLGLKKGVTSQLDECRDYATRMGWEVVDVISDNDVSALTSGKRPGYERLMRAVRAGETDHVVAWQMSRLWRNRVERAQGIEMFKTAQVGVAFAKGATFDFTSASGRGMAGMLGEVDTMESELKSERVLLDVARRVDAGLPNGSVPFGWTRRYLLNEHGKHLAVLGDFHHPEQAPVVAEVCRRLLAGKTLVAVTTWLNESGIPAPGAGYALRNRERGITNPTGAAWGKTSVKKLALRPGNAGLRLHHRGRPDEQVTPSEFIEPIITTDEHERLKALLARNPGAGVARPGGRKHLLTWGVGECGVCHGVLRSKPSGKAVLYVCDAPSGCVGRNQERVDAYVSTLMVERLTRHDTRDLLTNNEVADDAMARANGLRARLDTAADDYSDGAITREQLHRITARLKPQIAEAEKEAKTNAAPTVPVDLLAKVAGPQAGKVWFALDVAQQRILIEYLIRSVALMPTRRGPGFNEDDVHIDWHTATTTA